jgi:selenide,water dikinase
LNGLYPAADFPNLLVGLDAPDDAALWRLDDERALVATTDFFTPIVDDPYDYGAIAAANAISDVYAMGGIPFMALTVAAFPADLPLDFLAEIIRGGAEKVKEAGAVIAGGHTIKDKEPKFGLVVLGFADRRHYLTKGGAKPGDRLVLTKPIGMGVITTALKNQAAEGRDIEEAVGWMTRLNKEASRLAVEFNVRAATDVTGFSLLGHAWEMASASGVGLKMPFNRIPFLSGVQKYADQWIFPGGASDNRLHFEPHVQFAGEITEVQRMQLFDPQTSGGLLLSVPAAEMDGFLAKADQIHQPVWQIGEVTDTGFIEVF